VFYFSKNYYWLAALNFNTDDFTMLKFKIYLGVSIAFFLLTLLVSFPPVEGSEKWNEVRSTAITLGRILFFVCYSLLMSIFNYYKEGGWKNVAIIIFLAGNVVFSILSFSRAITNSFQNFFILIFYLPFIFAFATVAAKEIKPLTLSFAYLILVICLVHIVLPFIRGTIDLSAYIYFFDAIFLLPSVMIILLFSKMIAISGRNHKEELQPEEEQHDLL
jgi:hypothetical protein